MVSLLHIEKKRVVSACNLIENKVLDSEIIRSTGPNTEIQYLVPM